MVYLDHNATTPLTSEAREAMLPFLDGEYGNPSSIHSAGRRARAAVDDARDRMAALLGAKAHEIIFTGGGTESCNLGLIGIARAHPCVANISSFPLWSITLSSMRPNICSILKVSRSLFFRWIPPESLILRFWPV